MKLLRVEISRCYGCPYYRTPSDFRVTIDWCYAAGKLIEDISRYSIPKWCPLPDKEEADEQST